MPFYQKLGNIPPKRHTQFRQENGELYHEQLFGTIGFVGMSSLLYHRQRPTQVVVVQFAILLAELGVAFGRDGAQLLVERHGACKLVRVTPLWHDLAYSAFLGLCHLPPTFNP